MTDQLILTTAQRVNLCELIEKDGFPNQPAIDMLQSLAMVQGEPVARMLHSLKPLVTINSDIARSYTEYPDNKHPDVWREGAKLYTSPQALTPITAADITPAMHQEWSKIFHADDMSITCPKDGEIMAAAYNAVIKGLAK